MSQVMGYRPAQVAIAERETLLDLTDALAGRLGIEPVTRVQVHERFGIDMPVSDLRELQATLILARAVVALAAELDELRAATRSGRK